MKQQRTRRFMSDYCESMRAKLEAEARHTPLWLHVSCCRPSAGSRSAAPPQATTMQPFVLCMG